MSYVALISWLINLLYLKSRYIVCRKGMLCGGKAGFESSSWSSVIMYVVN